MCSASKLYRKSYNFRKETLEGMCSVSLNLQMRTGNVKKLTNNINSSLMAAPDETQKLESIIAHCPSHYCTSSFFR